MPEGHSASINEGYRLWKFYPGVIRLHLRYKIPIIPTAMIGFVKAVPIFSNKYNPQIKPPWEDERELLFILPYRLTVHFGNPINFHEYFNKQIDKTTLYKLANVVRQKVKKLISLYRTNITPERPLGTKNRSRIIKEKNY